MRGRLIFRFLAQIHRLDQVSSGYDPDFKESVLVDNDDDGMGERVRHEHPPVRIPCQVDTKAFEELRMLASGNSPRSKVDLVFHFKDLEKLALVDALSGGTFLRQGDRLSGIFDLHGGLVHRIKTPPGLYITESRPIGFGLNLAKPSRNLLLVSFEDRQTGARRYA